MGKQDSITVTVDGDKIIEHTKRLSRDWMEENFITLFKEEFEEMQFGGFR